MILATEAHKDTQEKTLINTAVPADPNMFSTDEEMVENCQELAFGVNRIHRALKVGVIPGFSLSFEVDSWDVKVGRLAIEFLSHLPLFPGKERASILEEASF